MATSHRRWRAAAAACLAAVVVSSCGSEPSAAPSAPRPASTSPARPSEQSSKPSPSAALPDADQRACVGVAAIISHIAVDTARWEPTTRPFDQDIASRLAAQTRYLDSQALAADLQVRRAVAATATAFNRVATAIMARNRGDLRRAIAQSRIAYSGLKKVCRLHS